MKDSGQAVADGQTSAACVNVDSVAKRVSPVNPARWSDNVKEKLEKRNWNTARLPSRLAVDVVSASCAAVLVAPVILTIDK